MGRKKVKVKKKAAGFLSGIASALGFDEKKDDDLVEEEEENTTPLYLNEFVPQLLVAHKFTDVDFIVGDSEEKVSAHKLILAASSPVFEAMLYPPLFGDETDSAPSTDKLQIRIKDTTPAVFKQLLECIYSDHTEVTVENIKDLIKVAKKYQIEKLQVLCAEVMEGDVNMKNALELFQMAPDLLGDEEFGMEFIAENAEAIVQSKQFLTLRPNRLKVLLESDKLAVDEVPLFLAVQKWAKEECKRRDLSGNPDELKEVLKDILPLIRFPTMELSEIASFVATSGLLSQDEMLSLFTYMSLQSDDEKTVMPMTWPTQPRSGGSITKDTKLIDKKMQKEVLRLFSSDGKKPAKGITLKLIFRGSRDGFNGGTFHAKCNGKGATLTVIRSKNNGYIFGGYHAGDWGEGNYSQAASWLFSLKGQQGIKAAKFLPSGTGNHAYCNQGYGPTWGGGHDLHVNTNMTSNSNYCSPHSYRTVAPGYGSVTYSNSSLAGQYNFMVDEIEVFAVSQKGKK